MAKPIREVLVRSVEGGSAKVQAVFDTGSYYSIIQEDKLPARMLVQRYSRAKQLKAAAPGGRLRVTGTTILHIKVGRKVVSHQVLVSPDLQQEMVVGAGTMWAWGIRIICRKRRHLVVVGRDVRDPDVREVD